jgi:hypothetical protein
MKIGILIILILSSVSALGGELGCPKVESEGEGHWSLSPEAFSKERYEEAIHYLNGIVAVNAKARDYINVDNQLMYIKGYMLKLHEENELFCEFIKNEAYVHH